MITAALLFSLWIALALQGLLRLHMNLSWIFWKGLCFSLLLKCLEPSLLPTRRREKESMPRILWINPINIFHPTWIPHPYQLYHSFPWCIRCVLLQISWTTCPSLIYNHKGQTWFTDPLKWGRLHTNRSQTKEKIEFYKIEGKGGVSEKFKESRILTGIKQGCVKAYGLQSGFQILFSWKP